MDVTTILWMFMLGAIAAVLTVFYNNKYLGKIVRALISIDATTPETAMTADELGVKITPTVKNAFKSNKSFSETVLITKDGRYYINPDKLALAKSKYRSKETSFIFIIMSIVILLVAAIALSYVLPDLLDKFSFDSNGIGGGGF